jgi:hypothetical protein
VGEPLSSSISGGQRKRVSIGLELAAAPVALFLDEPTSGLDATTALSLVQLLKTLSELRVTIICILHQPRPEILECLDSIHLLVEGHQVYHGKTGGLANYFHSLGFELPGHANIADAVLDIVSGLSDRYSRTRSKVTAKEFAQSWIERSHFTSTPGDGPGTFPHHETESLIHLASSRGASWPKQIHLCFMRSMRQQWRCKLGFVLEISVGAICGLLIGLAMYELRGRHFQGNYHSLFQILSSAVNHTLVPEIGLLYCMAMGQLIHFRVSHLIWITVLLTAFMLPGL